jgi:hypothetical protein
VISHYHIGGELILTIKGKTVGAIDIEADPEKRKGTKIEKAGTEAGMNGWY